MLLRTDPHRFCTNSRRIFTVWIQSQQVEDLRDSADLSACLIYELKSDIEKLTSAFASEDVPPQWNVADESLRVESNVVGLDRNRKSHFNYRVFIVASRKHSCVVVDCRSRSISLDESKRRSVVTDGKSEWRHVLVVVASTLKQDGCNSSCWTEVCLEAQIFLHVVLNVIK